VLETEIDILAQENEIDMDSLGFDDDEIDELLGEQDIPEFKPVDEDEQPDLDETNTTECPNCSHEFNPNF